MTTVKDIINYTNRIKEKKDNYFPIYSLFLFSNPNKELIFPTGEKSGFPDIGASYEAGFYYNVNEAVEVMNRNSGDIRETIYNAGFILCHFPGIYNNICGTEARMYFLWNEEEQGFLQAEEPEIFKYVSY